MFIYFPVKNLPKMGFQRRSIPHLPHLPHLAAPWTWNPPTSWPSPWGASADHPRPAPRPRLGSPWRGETRGKATGNDGFYRFLPWKMGVFLEFFPNESWGNWGTRPATCGRLWIESWNLRGPGKRVVLESRHHTFLEDCGLSMKRYEKIWKVWEHGDCTITHMGTRTCFNHQNYGSSGTEPWHIWENDAVNTGNL